MASTAPAKGRKKPKRAAKKPAPKPANHDGGLERIYTRVTPQTKAALDKIAHADARSTMQYLKLLVEREVERKTRKKGK